MEEITTENKDSNKTKEKVIYAKYNKTAKAIAYVLFFIISLFTIFNLSCFSFIYILDGYQSEEHFIEKYYEEYYRPFFYDGCMPSKDMFDSLDDNNSNVRFELHCEGKTIYSSPKEYNNFYTITLENHFYQKDNGYPEGYSIHIQIDKNLLKNDHHSKTIKYLKLLYKNRYNLIIYSVIFSILLIAISVFIFCSLGHKPDKKEISLSWIDKIPLDIHAGITSAIWAGIFVGISSFLFNLNINYIFYFMVYGLLIFPTFLLFSCFARRVKYGKWWRYTLTYHLIKPILKILKNLFKNFKNIFKILNDIVKNINIIWRTAVSLTVFFAIELIIMAGATCDASTVLVAFFFDIILFVGALYVAVILRKLQEGGEKLAKGDMKSKIDTSRLFWDFKKHANNLNSINDGIQVAVDEQLKSERLKTELITNVSHDIKTPLTSIINYTDLISKEDCDNEKIVEYTEVLQRQSEKLKRLIQNLVDASKASTGNLSVNLEPCEVNVLLSQTAGEYEEKLKEKNLQLITKIPEQPIKIMADGKHLWRVFDNLMNNICKYSQSGTRVYLTADATNGEVEICFKNISSTELNITTDELMERFVRGDSSRNTEGNGLGLNIAKSLTNIQNGTLSLKIDGDLFKVIIKFKTTS